MDVDYNCHTKTNQFLISLSHSFKTNLSYPECHFSKQCPITLALSNKFKYEVVGYQEFKKILSSINVETFEIQNYFHQEQLFNSFISILLYGSLLINNKIYPFISNLTVQQDKIYSMMMVIII